MHAGAKERRGERRGGRQRERTSFALAIALHVGVVALAWRLRPASVSPPVAPPGELSIQVEERPSTIAPPIPQHEESRAAGPAPAVARAVERALSPTSPTAQGVPADGSHATPDGASSVSPIAPTPPRPEPAPLSLAQLGLAGPNRFMTGAAPAESFTLQESEDRVRQSIADSLLKHDRTVGLGSEGPVVAEIESQVMASTAAVDGTAILSVVADAMGTIQRVDCLDGEHAQWDTIAAHIARALAGKRLRAAPGGRGVAMRIQVTSREQLPSGRDPGLEVRAFNLPVKKREGKRSTRIDLMEIKPRLVVDDTGEEGQGPQAQAAPVNFAKAHIELVKIFGLNGDPADIGVSARRVVHACVIEEHAL